MRLYIANGTHQNIDFQYRLPEYKTYRQQQIPIGGQIKISGELNEKQIEIIIQFHQKYGITKFSEIGSFKGFFVPYIYSIDNSISAEVIAELIIQNREYNKKLGERLRAEAAIAVNALIEENAGDKLTAFEIEITERQSKDRDATIDEKIVVTRDEKRGAPQNEERGTLSSLSDFIRSKPKSRTAF